MTLKTCTHSTSDWTLDAEGNIRCRVCANKEDPAGGVPPQMHELADLVWDEAIPLPVTEDALVLGDWVEEHGDQAAAEDIRFRPREGEQDPTVFEADRRTILIRRRAALMRHFPGVELRAARRVMDQHKAATDAAFGRSDHVAVYLDGRCIFDEAVHRISWGPGRRGSREFEADGWVEGVMRDDGDDLGGVHDGVQEMLILDSGGKATTISHPTLTVRVEGSGIARLEFRGPILGR